VDAFETTIKQAGVNHELFRYQAQHGFFNEQRPEVHDIDASNLAWERMLGFLNTHL
jgi:carboxymethylenebutenolidase